MTFDLDLYDQGYLAATLPILWIIFICGANTSHEGTMFHVPFPGQQVKGQGHTGHLHFCSRDGDWSKISCLKKSQICWCELSPTNSCDRILDIWYLFRYYAILTFSVCFIHSPLWITEKKIAVCIFMLVCHIWRMSSCWCGCHLIDDSLCL